MENHLKTRPHKKIFKEEKVIELRNKAVEKLKGKLLPDGKIVKIVLIGSSVKNAFGAYDPPGFRGSLFSDFDFIVFTENDFEIPAWLDREPDGKPFADESMNLAYRNKNFVENKYDIEVFFLRRSSFEDPVIQKQGEEAGLPMTPKTKHKHLIIHE